MKRISIMLSVFLLGFVLSSCAFLDALIESETKTSSKPSTSESSKAKTEEEKSTTVTASVGETKTINGLEFSVNSVSFSEYMGGLSGLNKAGNNNRYCVVRVTVHNPNKETKGLGYGTSFGIGKSSSYDFALDYNDGFKYYNSFASYSDFLECAESIKPLETLSDKILTFEVPAEVETNTSAPLMLTIKENKTSIFDTSSEEKVVWILR